MNKWICLLGIYVFTAPILIAKDQQNQTPPNAATFVKFFYEGSSDKDISCKSCHGLNYSILKKWADTGKTTIECIEESSTPIECLKTNSNTASYRAKKLGLLSAVAQSNYFNQIFSTSIDEFNHFKEGASMPPNNVSTFPQEWEQDYINWLKEGTPDLKEAIRAYETGDNGTCTSNYSLKLTNYLEKRHNNSWETHHRNAMTPMFGCSSVNDPNSCFLSQNNSIFQDAKIKNSLDYAGNGSILHLKDISPTRYWIRSSADGRFVATSSGIYDLRSLTNSNWTRGLISYNVDDVFDPMFYPDMSGVSFYHEVSTTMRARYSCNFSTLLNPQLTVLNVNSCLSERGIQSYQSAGTSLNQSDYFLISGTHTNDSGASNADPSTNFAHSSNLTLQKYIFDGTKYRNGSRFYITTPYEGDAIMSPAAGLISLRKNSVNNSSHQGSYIIREIIGSNTMNIANICAKGGKAEFSFNERSVVFHHYHDSRADIYIHDLKTQTTVQITRSKAGQYALFPHFRADGWIYFLLKSSGSHPAILTSNHAIKYWAANP